MPKSDLVRLRHMLDAAREALSFAEGRRREELDRNRMLSLSLLRLLETVGEAAGRVTEEARRRYPRLPWREIVDMRNRLVHGYDEIDLNRVWETVTADLPPLVRELEAILEAESG